MKKLLLALALLWAAPAQAVIQGTIVGNANYSFTNTDTVVRTSVAFSASRTWTLPFAAGTCVGQICKPPSNTLTVIDGVNAVSLAATLTIARQSGDTINGVAADFNVSFPGAMIVMWPTSPTNWQVVALPSTGTGSQALICTTFATMGAPAALTDVVMHVATRPMFLVNVSEVHAVAAGGTSTAQVVKDTGTDAPGAGTDLLSAAFNLNATANTVQTGALIATVATRTFAAGNRLSIDWADAVQSSSGIAITACFAPL